jgi:hypothetical protein
MKRRMEKANNKIFLGLTLAILVLSLFAFTRSSSGAAQSGVAIDLFTDQTPFNGKGANQSADTYEPQELVTLFGLATYNDAPVTGKLVAFQVEGPRNQFQNITIVGSGTTDENGTAEFSFRAPWPSQVPDEAIFGQWTAIATVEIAQQVAVDTLIFRIGYVLSVIEINTLNAQLGPQSVFTQDDPIVFNLTVQNIARTARYAIIKVDVLDSDRHPIIDLQTNNTLFQPGNTNVKAHAQIPSSAANGVANVSAAPFTAPPDQGGTLYSPAIYAIFTISAAGDIAITNVVTTSNMVRAGEKVNIDVSVMNEGNQSVSFDLSVYYNATWIGTLHVDQLAPLTQKTLRFVWDTSRVSNGVYQISASAPLPGDPTPADNTFVDGIVTIVSVTPFLPSELVFFFIFVLIAGIAGAILLFLLAVLDRTRRRRRSGATYTVIAHPHI